MLITVFDENFKRVNILRKYTFAQYTDRLRDIGEFEILAVLCDENIYFLDKNRVFYVLFDKDFFGKVEHVTKDSDSEYTKTINIKGRHCSFILDKRVIYKQQNYTGTPSQIIKQIMDKNIRETGPRFLNIVTSVPVTIRKQKIEDDELQKTGGTVFQTIQKIMETNRLGFHMHPEIVNYHMDSVTGNLTNISKWDFTIIDGKDRRRGNQSNNIPVIFSHSLNNLRRATYEVDRSSECNVAYVAGEGEGTERVWLEVVGENIGTGWYRNELFVDARDLQSETESGTLTTQQYNKILETRGREILSENTMFENYEATIIENENRYIYGKDYYKGDYVTIQDNEIGIEIGAQITEITVSVEGQTELRDMIFGYKSINVVQKLRREGAI